MAMKLTNTNWNFPTPIWFGVGRIKDLALACQQIGIKRPLFVTDEGLVKLDIVAQAVSVLEEQGIEFTIIAMYKETPLEKMSPMVLPIILKMHMMGLLPLEEDLRSMRPKQLLLCLVRREACGILRM